MLQAAITVFSTHGYADATVQDIADELGILKGSLYHYIDSKEDLLYRILDQTHAEVEAILESVRTIPDLQPLQRIREYTKRQILYTTANLARMAIYYHDVDQLSGQRRQDLHRQRRLHEAFITDLITQAQHNGQASTDLDARILSNCLFGSMIWMYRWYRPDGPTPATDIANTCAEYIARGLVAPAVAPSTPS